MWRKFFAYPDTPAGFVRWLRRMIMLFGAGAFLVGLSAGLAYAHYLGVPRVGVVAGVEVIGFFIFMLMLLQLRRVLKSRKGSNHDGSKN